MIEVTKMKKWKFYIIWIAFAILGSFTAIACNSWGLYDQMHSLVCIFDTDTFDSGCTFE